MAKWKSAVITDLGKELMAKVLTGSEISFTKIRTSEHKYSSDIDLSKVIEIPNIKQEENIKSIEVINKNTVSIYSNFSNKDLTAGYEVRVVGLYAKDPETETEILYSITTTDRPDYLPSFNGVTLSSIDYKFITAVGNAENVILDIIDGSDVTQQQFQELKGEVNHNKTQIDIILSDIETLKLSVDEAQVYDKVIRTQSEFETLIASPTWLGAVSVCFIGDGGTLKFTKSDGQGIKIPQTVKQIKGINSATIEVTNFVSNSSNMGGLWYATLPTTTDYSIDNIVVNCTGSINENTYGFVNCTQLTNCTGVGTGDYSYGFYNCTQLTNCTGVGTTNSGRGFHSCTQLTNCTGVGSGYNYSYGFDDCTQLTNCIGTGSGSGYGYGGHGFRNCTQLTNCTGTGTGTGSSEGYGFYDCKYLNGCKPSDTPSTSGLLGGTNTQVDTTTVQ